MCFWGNLLTCNRTIRAGICNPSTNFEIQKYYQNESKFNFYGRNNLPKIKDGAYVVNLDEYKSVGSH